MIIHVPRLCLGTRVNHDDMNLKATATSSRSWSPEWDQTRRLATEVKQNGRTAADKFLWLQSLYMYTCGVCIAACAGNQLWYCWSKLLTLQRRHNQNKDVMKVKRPAGTGNRTHAGHLAYAAMQCSATDWTTVVYSDHTYMYTISYASRNWKHSETLSFLFLETQEQYKYWQ